MNIDRGNFLELGSIAVFLGFLVLGYGPLSAQTQPNPSLQAYLGGLDDLRQGKYSEATQAFTQTMQGSSDPSFWLARGVAQCLNERLSEAVNDFNQARRMGIRGREAELWTYVAEMMGSGHGTRNPALTGGQGWFSGAPGYITKPRFTPRSFGHQPPCYLIPSFFPTPRWR